MAATTRSPIKANTTNELDVISAIEAHVRWKIRLESYINGSGSEKLDADVVCKDDQCALGKWIYGAGGTRFGHTDRFNELKSTHAQFHRCAADVIREADKGDKQAAMKLLIDGDYDRYSYRVKTMLARLWLETDK